MLALNLERLGKQDENARENGYATDGPVLRATAWDYINRFARLIKATHESRSIATHQTQGDKCLFRLIDLYAQIPAEAIHQVDELDEGGLDETECDDLSPYKQPDLSYLLIATSVWKTLLDVAMTPGGSVRNTTTTMVGKMLGLQYRVLHYQYLITKYDADHIDAAKHINHMIGLVKDNGANFERRLGRAVGLFQELDKGEVIIKRGRKAGSVLTIPKLDIGQTLDHGEFTRWQDIVGEELANMLVHHPDEPSDSFCPFEYYKAGDHTNIQVRKGFHEILDAVLNKIGRYQMVLLPLVEPPLDWTADGAGATNRTGGYHTARVREFAKMVRSVGGDCHTKPSQQSIDLLNTLQRTPWRIDKDQLALVVKIALDWHKDYDGILRPEAYTIEELRNGTGAAATVDQVQFRQANTEQYGVILRKLKAKQKLTAEEDLFRLSYEENNIALRELYRKVANSKQNCSAMASLIGTMQDHMVKEQQLFFAWNNDHRVRCYPVGSVTPQGRPAERFTFEFARGERLSASGERAGLLALGTAAIDSKVAIDKRIAWAEDNLDLIRGLAEGTDRAITVAGELEEPLNLLALSRAWVQHEQGGLWHKPVYADATNSGWQLIGALTNNITSLGATNCLASSTDQDPKDAYRQAVQAAIRILDRGETTITPKGPDGKKLLKRVLNEFEIKLIRQILLNEDGTVSKLGRACSKASGRTSIYGSGMETQSDDIETELLGAGYSSTVVTVELRNVLTRLIAAGYRECLGDPGAFNRTIRRAAEAQLFRGVDPDVVTQWRELNAKRVKGIAKSDLQGENLRQYLDACRKIKEQSAGLMFTMPDRGVIDMAQYVSTTVRYKTVFHGSPTITDLHLDCYDPKSMLSAIAPALIHSLDGRVLAGTFANWDVDCMGVHDSGGVHPNNFDEMCHRYRQSFLHETRGDFLMELGEQWGHEIDLVAGFDSRWRTQVMDAVYLFH